MIEKNKQALIVAYYLSKYNIKGYRDLGYKNFSEAARDISTSLGIKFSTFQNMRDEFDPYHENNRVGWHQKGLTISRRNVMESFRYINEQSLREIALEIIIGKKLRDSTWINSSLLLNKINDIGDTPKEDFPRGVTGDKAEKYFIEYFNKYQKPFKGILTDKRSAGCGYDFEIASNNKKYFIEVKGISSEWGGILFTNKEWYMARLKKKAYTLAIILDLKNEGEIYFFSDPAKIFSAEKKTSLVPRIDWHVSSASIKTIISSGAADFLGYHR